MPLDEFHTTHYFSVKVINREYFFLLSIAIFDIIRLIMFLSFFLTDPSKLVFRKFSQSRQQRTKLSSSWGLLCRRFHPKSFNIYFLVFTCSQTIGYLKKDVFHLVTSVGQRKNSETHEESYLRPSDSALRCPTTEPQRLHFEQGS